MRKSLDEVILDKEEFAFVTGKHFRGLTISQHGGAFRIILRAFGAGYAPLYCLTEHEDVHEGLANLLAALGSRGGAQLWRHDKFYQPTV